MVKRCYLETLKLLFCQVAHKTSAAQFSSEFSSVVRRSMQKRNFLASQQLGHLDFCSEDAHQEKFTPWSDKICQEMCVWDAIDSIWESRKNSILTLFLIRKSPTELEERLSLVLIGLFQRILLKVCQMKWFGFLKLIADLFQFYRESLKN